MRHRTEREKRGGGAERARISQPEGLRGPNVDPGGRLQVSGTAVRLRAQACHVAFAFWRVCSARGASPTDWHGNDRRAWSWCTGTDRLGGRPKGVCRAATALSRLYLGSRGSRGRGLEKSKAVHCISPLRAFSLLLPFTPAGRRLEGQQKVHHLRGAQGAHGWSGQPFGATFLRLHVCPARTERTKREGGAWMDTAYLGDAGFVDKMGGV